MTSFGGFETCEFEEFVSEATPQANTLEEAASTQEILIQQLEGYLARLKAAICADFTTVETQIPVPLDEFTELIDTPGTYVGAGLFSVRVNVLETGLEFAPYPVVQGADHGLLVGLADDDHLQYLLLAGRAGGQTANGGTVAGESLVLRGRAGAPDTGIIEIQSPRTISYDTFSNTTPAQQFTALWNPTTTISASYIGGYLSVAYDFTVTTGVYIPATFSDTGTSRIAAVPGFSAYTFINQLHVIRNSGNFNLPSGLVANIGLTHERNTAGTSTSPGTTGLSFSPQTRATVAGAIITKTSHLGLRMAPTFSTVAGSTANLGTIIGVQCNSPAVALFQPAAGVETMTAYIGLDFAAMTFGGNVTKVVVRSALAAATNARFLQNNSTAASTFGTSVVHHSDNGVIQFGGTLNAADVSLFWAGGGFFEMFFWSTSDFLQWSSPAADRFLVQANAFGTTSEINFAFDRFAFGQSSPVGNQVGVFVAPTRTTGVNGDWADFLLTQAGNLTIDNAMGTVAAWIINPVSLTIGTGSIAGPVVGLSVGMTTSSLGGADTCAIRQLGRRLTAGVDSHQPLSPAQLTSDVNDYAPATGNAMRQVWRLDSDASRTITGIAVQQQHDTQWITNIGANPIVLGHQDVLSAAANRMISPSGANYTLGPDESALLWYDIATVRWRILWGTGA